MRLRFITTILCAFCLSFQALAYTFNASNSFLRIGRNGMLTYPSKPLTYQEFSLNEPAILGMPDRLQKLVIALDRNKPERRLLEKLQNAYTKASKENPDNYEEVYMREINAVIDEIKKIEQENKEEVREITHSRGYHNLFKMDPMIDDRNNEDYMPAYCKNYPSLGHDSYEAYMSGANAVDEEEAPLFSCEGAQGTFAVEVSGIVDNFLEIEQFTKNDGEKLFRNKLLTESLLQVTKSRYNLYGLFDNMKIESPELTNCIQRQAIEEGNDELIKKYEEDEKNYQTMESTRTEKEKSDRQTVYMRHLMLNALKAEAVVQEMQEETARFDRELNSLEQQLIMVGGSGVNFAGAGDLAATGANYTEEMSRLSSQMTRLESEKKEKLNRYQSELNQMFHANPTLFKMQNDWNIFDWVNYKVHTSDFQKNIVNSNEAKQLVEQIRQAKTQDPASVDNYIKENSEKFLSFFDSKTNDNAFKNQVKASVEGEIAEINKSANHLCKNDGENLHHFKGLTDEVFIKIADEAPNREAAKVEIMKHQAAYCHMLRTDPPTNGDFNVMDAIGIGAVIAGLFVPGVGWAISAAGATVMAANAAAELKESILMEGNSRALEKAGWETIDAYLQNKNRLGDAVADAILEGTIIFDGLAVASAVRRGAAAGAKGISTAAGAADEVATLATRTTDLVAFKETLRRSNNLSKFEDVLKVPGVDPNLMDDFLKNLAEINPALSDDFLKMVNSGAWNPLDLKKIMEDAISKSCKL